MQRVLPFRQFAYLMRLDKPIGILLLLWPTCWALWLAAKGRPPLSILLIFLLGVVLMRSAGCVINDIFDREFDRHIARTCKRPLAAGTVSVNQALILAAGLLLLALVLVLFCNRFTILLSCFGAIWAVVYPLLKRITHLPQLGLGVAFSWGVLMAFAAITNHLPPAAWLVFVTALIWPVIYDTMYAMADRAEDVKIGVKSTAILFGEKEVLIIGCLMMLLLLLLVMMGQVFQLYMGYYVSIMIVAALFARQLQLIHSREPARCFQAFLENNLVGLVIFAGILI